MQIKHYVKIKQIGYEVPEVVACYVKRLETTLRYGPTVTHSHRSGIRGADRSEGPTILGKGTANSNLQDR